VQVRIVGKDDAATGYNNQQPNLHYNLDKSMEIKWGNNIVYMEYLKNRRSTSCGRSLEVFAAGKWPETMVNGGSAENAGRNSETGNRGFVPLKTTSSDFRN
jgi:hypothetical protein